MRSSGHKSSKLTLFSIVFVDLLGFGIMIPMLPFYARDLGASAFEIGLLMAAYSIVQFFSAPLWGKASDSFGRKPILMWTVFGQAVCFAIAALAGSYWILLVSRALAGGFGGNISAASAYMADITSTEDRAKGMGLIGAAIGLGFVFGPAIGGILVQWSYEWPSWAAAILSILNFFAISLFLVEPLRNGNQRTKNRRSFSLQDIRAVASQIDLIRPIVIFFLFTFAFVQLEVSFGLLVVDRFLFSERTAGLLLAGVGLMMALVQATMVGRLVKFWGEGPLIFMGSFLLAGGLFQLSLAQSPLGLAVALFALALGYSLANPSLMSFVSKKAGRDRYGSVMGIYQSGGSAARAIAPLFAGGLYAASGAYPSLLGGVLVLAAAVICLLPPSGFLRSDVSRPKP